MTRFQRVLSIDRQFSMTMRSSGGSLFALMGCVSTEFREVVELLAANNDVSCTGGDAALISAPIPDH